MKGMFEKSHCNSVKNDCGKGNETGLNMDWSNRGGGSQPLDGSDGDDNGNWWRLVIDCRNI